MSAPLDNKFWKARSSHGRKPIYDNSEDLLDACYQYFNWNNDNPLFEMKPFNVGGEVIQEPVAIMRAMTISAMARYVGMSHETWIQYKKKDDFSEVCEEVEQIIKDQKFTGAAGGLLNASIIARDLGLKDKTESDVNVNIAEKILSEIEEDNGLPSNTKD